MSFIYAFQAYFQMCFHGVPVGKIAAIFKRQALCRNQGNALDLPLEATGLCREKMRESIPLHLLWLDEIRHSARKIEFGSLAYRQKQRFSRFCTGFTIHHAGGSSSRGWRNYLQRVICGAFEVVENNFALGTDSKIAVELGNDQTDHHNSSNNT
jgi:hypothetical protein